MTAHQSAHDATLSDHTATAHASVEAARTPWILRVCRIVRASLHLLQGLATIVLVFPFVQRRRRKRLIRRWSARLLRHFRIEMRMHGALPQDCARGMLLVANHVSWLDIFVLNAVEPSRFIAKAELRRWPVVGWLIAGVGTLFIDRGHRRHTHMIGRAAADALVQGDVVAVFPEGRVTDGRDVLPFHGSLLQPIVDVQGCLQPVAIRYGAPREGAVSAAAFVGTFLQSVWRITREARIVVELHVTPPLSTAECHRRELAQEAERAIRGALGLPAPARITRPASD